jgi:hypothetical protein
VGRNRKTAWCTTLLFGGGRPSDRLGGGEEFTGARLT